MEFITDNLAIIVYIIIINLISFVAFGIDKTNAKKGARRIPEIYLFVFAIIGGSIGAYAGMKKFRHKKYYTRFSAGIPAIIIIQIIIIAISVIVLGESADEMTY